MEQVVIKKAEINAADFNEKSGKFRKGGGIFKDYSGMLHVKDHVLRRIAISESGFSRHYGNDLKEFIILKFIGFNHKNIHILGLSFKNGINIMGNTFYPFLQSSSQDKDNEIFFTCKSEIERELSELMKIDLSDPKSELNFIPWTDKKTIKTFSARASMTTSNGLATGVYLTKDNFTVIDDPTTVMDVQGKAFLSTLDGKLSSISKELGHQHHDGQSCMSFVALAEIAYGIGAILKGELRYFLDNWKGLPSLEGDKKLLKIFDKMEYACQMRAPGIKGMIIAIDFYTLRNSFNPVIREGHNPITEDVHFILGEGAVKYVPDFDKYGDVELQWMAWSGDKAPSSTLSIQTLSSLNLSIEDVKKLSDKAKNMFDNVLSSPEAALDFLGAYFSVNIDEESFDNQLVSKLHKALTANKNTLHESWVQKGLMKKLLGKKDKDGVYVEEGALVRAKYGELPIQGNFYYVVADPYAHLGMGNLLESGEVHFNNHSDRELALMRYPNVHESELVRKDAVAIKEYSYLRNILITNAKDDLYPRMAGMDTDGDMVLVVFDVFIINNIRKEHLVLAYGENVKKTKSQLTMDSYVSILLKSITIKSLIGTITNNAGIWRDLELHRRALGYGKDDKGVRFYHKQNFILKFLQGFEIDKSKTGIDLTIDDSLFAQFCPNWFYNYLLEIKGNSKEYLDDKYKDGKLLYDSKSAVGFNHKYFVTYEKSLLKKISSLDKRVKIDGFIDYMILNKDFQSDLASANYDKIKDLDSAYRTDARDIYERSTKGSIDEETTKYLFSKVFEKYQALMDSIDMNELTKLYVAYTVSMKSDSKSDTFYRVFCFDALIDVYAALADDKQVMIKVDNLVEKVTVKGGKVYFDSVKVMDTLEGDFKILKGVRSSYDTFTIGDGTYIMAEVKNDIDLSSLITRDERSESMNHDFIGIKHYAFKDMTPDEITNELFDSKVTLNYFLYDGVSRVGIYSDGRFVGMVKKVFTEYVERYVGFQLTVIKSTTLVNKKGELSYLKLEYLLDSKVDEAIEFTEEEVAQQKNEDEFIPDDVAVASGSNDYEIDFEAFANSEFNMG